MHMKKPLYANQGPFILMEQNGPLLSPKDICGDCMHASMRIAFIHAVLYVWKFIKPSGAGVPGQMGGLNGHVLR